MPHPSTYQEDPNAKSARKNLLDAIRALMRQVDPAVRGHLDGQKTAIVNLSYRRPDQHVHWAKPEHVPEMAPLVPADGVPMPAAMEMMIAELAHLVDGTDAGGATAAAQRAVAEFMAVTRKHGDPHKADAAELPSLFVRRRSAKELKASTGGRAYVRPARGDRPDEPESRVFEYDPDLIDRGTTAHKDVQDALAAAVEAHQLEPLSPKAGDPAFDIAWRDDNVAYVCEVKSITAENEERQLRLGLGQLLSYLFRLDWHDVDGVRGVLAVEQKPVRSDWIELCAKYGVILTWPGEFPGVFETET